MRKLLLSLMVLASLVSCGKDNNNVNGGTATTVTNPIVTGSTYAQELVTKINNPSSGFGTGVLYINTAAAQTCKEKWIFTVCTTSSSGSNATATTWNAIIATRDLTYQYANNNYISRSVLNSSVIVSTKQKTLIDLLNSATAISGYAPQYTITVSGVQYVIDTRYPIQANPVRSGSEYFYQAI